MSKIVGFDYHLKLKHLEYIAQEAQDNDVKTMYQKLKDYLKTEIEGPTSRKKVTTMLMRIWYLVAEEDQELQTEAFLLLAGATGEERLAIHWAMTLLAYDFFTDLVTELGNQFTLQTEVATGLVARKMKRQYGDKRRVEIATGAIFQSLKDWGVLESESRGRYRMKGKIEITDQKIKLWLARMIIRVSQFRALPLEMIPSSPCVFPFKFELNSIEMIDNGFSVNRQGLDTVMVSLS